MSDLNASYDDGTVPAWRERKNLILGGLVGAAVLLLAGYFLLFSGTPSEDLGPVVSAQSQTGGGAPAPSASASASPTGASTLPAVFEEDIYGDPFAPLYPPAPVPKASTVSVDTGSSTTTGSTTTNGSGTGSTPTTPAAVPTKPKSTTASVKLVDVVDDNTVIVMVNGSKDESTYNIGTEFGGYFALISTRADEGEATFSFGDGSPFTLTTGQTKKFVV